MKKSSVSTYLSAVRSQAGSRYNNAGGNFHNAGGPQLLNSPSNRGMRPGNWNANGSANSFPSAQPLIVQVSNASAAAVSGFDVFGAGQYLTGAFSGGTWSNAGNFTLNGVTISSVMPNVSYQQILQSTINNPFTAGGVYLQSITGATAQVTDIFSVTSVNQYGSSYSTPIKPFLDSYQFQASVIYNTAEFNMGNLTKLTWNTIYASAVFQITVFPAGMVTPEAALNGNRVQNMYTRPQVVSSLRGQS